MRKALAAAVALVLAGGYAAYAQPPGGGRGGFTPPTFESFDGIIEGQDPDGKITVEEIKAYFDQMFAARGGGPPGGGDSDDFAANIFAQWNVDGKGDISPEDFANRPQRGRGGRPGGPPPGGAN